MVVGEVIECEQHPNADKLSVCTVQIGAAEPLQIVCGAKNVRAGIMPPLEEGVGRPSAEEIAALTQWIKYEALDLNATASDPGKITVRRLNRAEYRNTINDLMGIEFNSEVEFPPDDAGDGFDNMGEVLTISPLLLEKYLQAAEVIVERAVPKVSRVMPNQTATGREFRGAEGGGTGERMLVTKPAKVALPTNTW